MKKAKILALTLVAALMLTGGAYALWNQSINLSTTAAMGNMNVAVVADPSVYPMSSMPGIPDASGLYLNYGEDYMNPMTGSVTNSGHDIQVTIGKMYPGAKYGLNYTIKNSGDVPFSLKGVSVTCTNNADLFAKLTGKLQFYYQKSTGVKQAISVDCGNLNSATLGTTIASALASIVVYPGDELTGFTTDAGKVTTFMTVSVDSGIAGSDFESQSTSFNIAFDWQQCNPVQVA